MNLKIISFYCVSLVRYKRNAVLIKRSKSGRILCHINISIINYNQSEYQWETMRDYRLKRPFQNIIITKSSQRVQDAAI